CLEVSTTILNFFEFFATISRTPFGRCVRRLFLLLYMSASPIAAALASDIRLRKGAAGASRRRQEVPGRGTGGLGSPARSLTSPLATGKCHGLARLKNPPGEEAAVLDAGSARGHSRTRQRAAADRRR